MNFRRYIALFSAMALAAIVCLAGCASTKPKMGKGELKGWWIHTIRSGDSLKALAANYDRDIEMIAKANDLANPVLLYEGMVIYIPPKGGAAVNGGKEDYQDMILANRPGEENKPFWKPIQNLAAKPIKLIGSQVKRPLSSSAEEPKPTRAPDADRLGFAWPLAKRSSGAKFKETKYGMDMEAPLGTPVLASRSGVVISDKPLRGFGNMVIIDHGDGYVSVYAHLHETIAKMDRKVKRGETIARVGSTGAVETPMLSFQIRKQNRSVPPLQYLPNK